MDKEIYRLAGETQSLLVEVDRLNEQVLQLNIFMIKASHEINRLKSYVRSME